MVFGIFELARRDDPLANPKSARLWATQLPANDPVGALEAVIQLLENPAAFPEPVTVDRVRGILELDRIISPTHALLQAQYRLASVSDEVRQRLWAACDRLARAFAQAYERACAALAPNASREKARSALHGAFARLFYYVGVQARHGLFRYERWIPGRWTMLHQAYSEACRRGVVAAPFVADPQDPAASRLSPEQEYLQILLLQRLNTGNLTPQQIDQAAAWLREWVPQLRLAIQQPDGDGYWLDLGRGDGLVTERPANHAGELLYLDVAPLRAELEALWARLIAQAEVALTPPNPNELADIDSRGDLVRRLNVLWFPQSPKQERRGERYPERRSVTVAVGWAEIVPVLTLNALQRSTAPAGYHYDDYGRLRPNRDGVTPPSQDPRTADLCVWEIQDASDSGYRIHAAAQEAARLRLGALLALRKDDEHERWQLGLVRRMKRINAEQTELGVEVISRAVSLIAPKPVASRSTGYSVDGIDIGLKGQGFNALFLPGQSRPKGGSRPTIVLPPAEFTVGRPLSLQVEGHSYEVALAPPLERTKDWVWTPLELGVRQP